MFQQRGSSNSCLWAPCRQGTLTVEIVLLIRMNLQNLPKYIGKLYLYHCKAEKFFGIVTKNVEKM